jgi:outer membrane immunogenic protein
MDFRVEACILRNMYQMGALMMIRKFFVSAATLAVMTGGALAADLPNTKGPPMFAPPPPPVFSWTGLYVGGQVGYQWGRSDPNLVLVPGNIPVGVSTAYNDQGIVGGGHIGYNYQISQFVIGIEGDGEGSSYRGSISGLGLYTNTNNEIEGSVRGRAGIAWDRVLFYGTGGVAFASIRNQAGVVGFPPLVSATTGRVGWTAGAGVEYAVDPNWSVRVEYRYTDYGYYDFGTAPGVALREHETDNRVEAGFSYKFDMMAPPAPVVAKY